jgi:molecular chaperone GrpE
MVDSNPDAQQGPTGDAQTATAAEVGAAATPTQDAPSVDNQALQKLAEAMAQQLAVDAQKAVRDAQLRAAAEIDNIRKRTQRDIENAQRFALERFAGELLAVRDSLEIAVASHAKSPADSATLAAGQHATLQLLQKAFDKFAIQQISPVAVAFDPNLHEAVMNQPSASLPPGQVIDVLQPGYQLNGRLLRPARVIVAAAIE